MYVCVYVYIYMCVYIYIYIYIYIYECVCTASMTHCSHNTCKVLCVHMYVCFFIYIHTYIHTNKQANIHNIYIYINTQQTLTHSITNTPPCARRILQLHTKACCTVTVTVTATVSAQATYLSCM